MFQIIIFVLAKVVKLLPNVIMIIVISIEHLVAYVHTQIALLKRLPILFS